MFTRRYHYLLRSSSPTWTLDQQLPLTRRLPQHYAPADMPDVVFVNAAYIALAGSTNTILIIFGTLQVAVAFYFPQ